MNNISNNWCKLFFLILSTEHCIYVEGLTTKQIDSKNLVINASSNANNVAHVVPGDDLFIFDPQDENSTMTMNFLIPFEIGKIALLNPQNLLKFEITVGLVDSSVHTFLVSEISSLCVSLLK